MVTDRVSPTSPASGPESAMTRDLVDLANTVRIACQRVSRSVRYDSGDVLPPHQLAVLFHLLKGPMTPGELAEAERVSAPSMSKTVAVLAELRLVERTDDPDDGRRCPLVLTTHGTRTVHGASAHRDWFMVQRLESLSQDDRDLLRDAARLLNEVAGR